MGEDQPKRRSRLLSLDALRSDVGVRDSITALQWLGLWLIAALPLVVFISLFSSLGLGVDFLTAISSDSRPAEALAATAVTVCFAAWLVPLEIWHVWAQAAVGVVAGVGIIALTALLEQASPVVPLGVFIVVVPSWGFIVRRVLQSPRLKFVEDGRIETYQYFSTAWRISVGLGLSCLLVWVLSLAVQFEANQQATGAADVPPDDDAEGMVKYLACDGEEASCLRPFVLWASPFIATLVLFLYGLLAFALVDADQPGEQVLLHPLAACLIILLSAVFVSAEVACAGAGLTKIIIMFAGATAASLCMVTGLYIKMLEDDVAFHGDGAVLLMGDDNPSRALNLRHLSELRHIRATLRTWAEGESSDWLWAGIALTPVPVLAVAYVGLDMLRLRVLRSTGLKGRLDPSFSAYYRDLPALSAASVQALAYFLGTGDPQTPVSGRGQHELSDTDRGLGKNWSSIFAKVATPPRLRAGVGCGGVPPLIVAPPPPPALLPRGRCAR